MTMQQTKMNAKSCYLRRGRRPDGAVRRCAAGRRARSNRCRVAAAELVAVGHVLNADIVVKAVMIGLVWRR